MLINPLFPLASFNLQCISTFVLPVYFLPELFNLHTSSFNCEPSHISASVVAQKLYNPPLHIGLVTRVIRGLDPILALCSKSDEVIRQHWDNVQSIQLGK